MSHRQSRSTKLDATSDHEETSNRKSEEVLQVIGRYRLAGELGSGRFGVVYRGVDAELQREVAIKIPRPQRDWTQNKLEVFRREARIVASLRHPHLVSVYDFGVTSDERPYVVSEFIGGGSLQSRLKAGKYSCDEAVRLIAGVAEALHAAHKQGVIHRDVKPANILLDEENAARIADFGLALHEHEQSRRRNEQSGSPAYMAPEQVQGRSHHLDGRTDIWALGVVLYEMLTGQRPFRETSLPLLFDEIQNRDPKPLRMIDESIPAEIERIVLRCLAKEPSERYSSAHDLAEDLIRWSRGCETVDDTVRSGSAIKSAPRLHGWLVVTIGIAAVLSCWAIIGKSPYGSSPKNETQKDAASTARATLDGEIHLLIWDPDDESRRGLPIDSPGVLPLRGGDQFRVVAEVSQPAYLYLVWIQPDGRVDPLYPWTPGDWNSRPASEEKRKSLSLPRDSTKGWEIIPTGGLDALLLFASQTPLPHDVDLQALLAAFPRQTTADETILTVFDRDTQSRLRGASFDAVEIEDPVLLARQYLHQQFGETFEVIRAIGFSSQPRQ